MKSEETHWEVLKFWQNSSLCKLQVRTSNHSFLALLKLEGYLVCNSTALYKADIGGHLQRQQYEDSYIYLYAGKGT